MTTQLDKVIEARQTARHDALVRAIEYDLQGSVAHSGGELKGFNVIIGEEESLVVLKGLVGGVLQVAFVGSETIASAICKAVTMAKQDRLRWKEDKWAEKQD